mmetsp:Transcript_11260/g.24212  ORF Transcript_11260/g.24212 Transcript_11260/m.24212 type:complete len:87 (-) Transcript_11260:99-359(-)
MATHITCAECEEEITNPLTCQGCDQPLTVRERDVIRVQPNCEECGDLFKYDRSGLYGPYVSECKECRCNFVCPDCESSDQCVDCVS